MAPPPALLPPVRAVAPVEEEGLPGAPDGPVGAFADELPLGTFEDDELPGKPPEG
jgi:hypothetical protein